MLPAHGTHPCGCCSDCSWIEKRIEVLKEKAESDPTYLEGWEKIDLRPKL